MDYIKQTDSAFDCVIVGAGMAGLMAATVLAQAGCHVCVLEKGRGLGGRMATRRRDGAVFDHGAQFFTVRDERFEPWVKTWLDAGLVTPWYDLGESGTHYRGAPGMTSIAKHLASGLDVHRETHVDKVSFFENRWKIYARENACIEASHLLITAPVPQAMALLDAGKVTLEDRDAVELREIRFHRCIAVLAVLDQCSAITELGGALKLNSEPVQWIADNQLKGISPSVPSVTIHSTPAFAEVHWDVEDAIRIPKLIEGASEHLGAKVTSCESHRWGFSQPIGRYREEAFVDSARHLAIAGDGLAGSRVEGAALSGLRAGHALATLIKSRTI